MTDHAAVAGRIGPNAVIRLAEAAEAALGRAAAARVFARAGLAHRLDAPPDAMVDEGEVVALYAALAETAPEAAEVAAEAGRRTADYLLAHRIPKPVQILLRLAPPGLAARVLLAAIGRHAWTFAGTGAFSAETGRGARVAVAGGPFAADGPETAPLRAFYAAVFERLFRTLVSRATEARAEAGGGRCVIALGWRRAAPTPVLPGAPGLG